MARTTRSLFFNAAISAIGLAGLAAIILVVSSPWWIGTSIAWLIVAAIMLNIFVIGGILISIGLQERPGFCDLELLLAKIEVTKGTDSVPGGGTNAVRVNTGKITTNCAGEGLDELPGLQDHVTAARRTT